MTKTSAKKDSTRRAPRSVTPLTRERIVAAALALVADESLSGLTTRKLGERLGCEAMSIYHHFPSKQHLLDALVERAISSVVVPEPGPDLEARIRSSLDSYRAMTRRWPALFPLLAVHRLNMPAGVRFIESILRLIHPQTGDDELTARHFRVMGYYLAGAGLEETAGYARGPSAAEPVDDAFIARECPRLMAAAPYFQESQWDATWQLGIDALLARASRDVAARSAAPTEAAPRRKGRGSTA
ncbi:MAG: TetR/AcrR family transcriptional regulator [Caldimonas sp.]